MRYRFSALLCALAFLLSPPLHAAERTLKLDPGATDIQFTLGAFLHTVEGKAKLAKGEIQFDPDGGKASGKIVIDAKSADTGSSGRDKDMHEMVLQSAKFPEITLDVESTEGKVADDGKSKVTVKGKLEIHGGSHAVSWPAEIEAKGDKMTVQISFEIPYVEWGMKDPSKPVLKVEKVVKVHITAHGTVSH